MSMLIKFIYNLGITKNENLFWFFSQISPPSKHKTMNDNLFN